MGTLFQYIVLQRITLSIRKVDQMRINPLDDINYLSILPSSLYLRFIDANHPNLAV